MAQLQAILNYQEADRKLFKLERDFAASNERKEYVKIKKYLESAMEKLDALELKATSLKAEAAELSKKYMALEETLNDFENLDELVTGGADIAFYKKKAQLKIDQLKKFKADLSALTAAIKETDEEYQKLKKQVIGVEKQRPAIVEKYQAAKAAIEPERQAIEGELKKLEKDVPTELLGKYKTKRKEKLFPVIGALMENRCPFCSMEPPLVERNKLSGGGTIECFTCHRLLFGE
ncbi:MAG: hypothetical protein IJY05_01420 [Clostridia bacterium]|nr:hypothetical protein [Clostridia bacterium]